MAVFNNIIAGSSGQVVGGGEYAIERSLRFNSSDSAYLSRTPASAGNRRTFTFSFWVKRGTLPNADQMRIFNCGPYTSGTSFRSFNISFNGKSLFVWDYLSTYNVNLESLSFYRDPSAWYHIAVIVDTTQATSTDRVKIYVNGVAVTGFISNGYPSQNYDTAVGVAEEMRIGTRESKASEFFDGYLADFRYLDGVAASIGDLGEFDDNGIWQPIAYSGSYGTNGFHLPFSDNSTAAALGTDTSGNGNTWTVNNLSVTAGAGNDSVVDVPTNGSETDTGVGAEVRGNYATWNALNAENPNTLTNGNLDSAGTGSGGERFSYGTVAAFSGKWYYELTVGGGSVNCHIGAADSASKSSFYITYQFQGNLFYEGGLLTSGWGATYTSGDVIGVALDLDNGAIYFSKNGTWQASGVPTSGASKTGAARSFTPRSLTPLHITYNTTNVDSANFGQRPFAYTAPSGFKALNTANLPAPVVTKPSEYMDVALYTGNGGTQTISGLEFSPDFVWTKRRDGAGSHGFFDVIRGATKWLGSNSTNSEQTYSDSLTSFDSDGFTLGADTVWNGINQSSQTYVAWTWDAGSSTVTNTQGSISSQVRANASAGFSVVTYTGTGVNATVGHGLGAAPELIITKSRNNAFDWTVYHKSLGISQYLFLNSTAAATSTSNYWNTAPTSTIFGVGNNNTGSSGNNIVAYCFAPVAGYSSMGSYVGNFSTDGPFVYTGFRPRFVLTKASSSGGNWQIIDSTRSDYNLADDKLWPSQSYEENSATLGGAGADNIDILSNGFKLKNANNGTNGSGVTYIYAAFAESPMALNNRAR